MEIATEIADGTHFMIEFVRRRTGTRICGYALDLRGTTARELALAMDPENKDATAAGIDRARARVLLLHEEDAHSARGEESSTRDRAANMRLARLQDAPARDIALVLLYCAREARFFADAEDDACAHCGAERPTNRCERCLVARYCGRACQTADWEDTSTAKEGHRHQCREDERFIRSYIKGAEGGERVHAFDELIKRRRTDRATNLKAQCDALLLAALCMEMEERTTALQQQGAQLDEVVAFVLRHLDDVPRTTRAPEVVSAEH